MKKKLLVLLLIVVCLISVFALASCDGGNNDDGRPSYTVTFDPAGGTFDGELTIQVKEGDKIPEPAKPVFDGRIFSGWYSGKSSSSRWDFACHTFAAAKRSNVRSAPAFVICVTTPCAALRPLTAKRSRRQRKKPITIW